MALRVLTRVWVSDMKESSSCFRCVCGDGTRGHKNGDRGGCLVLPHLPRASLLLSLPGAPSTEPLLVWWGRGSFSSKGAGTMQECKASRMPLPAGPENQTCGSPLLSSLDDSAFVPSLGGCQGRKRQGWFPWRLPRLLLSLGPEGGTERKRQGKTLGRRGQGRRGQGGLSVKQQSLDSFSGTGNPLSSCVHP